MSSDMEEIEGSLASLEESVLRAVALVNSLRKENQELRAAIQDAAGSKQQMQKLTMELESLRGERKQVRTRIEKLLGQMDLLSTDNG
jgi:uncharacterized coiled-coil DUF342 family protein